MSWLYFTPFSVIFFKSISNHICKRIKKTFFQLNNHLKHLIMNIFNNLTSLLLKSTLFLLLINVSNIQAQNKQLSKPEIEAKAKVYQHLFSGTSSFSKKEINKIKSTKKANCGTQQFNASINGECHNINNADWGRANIPLFREIPSEYGPSDPLNALGGVNRANPRSISNAVSRQDSTVFPSQTLSSFVFSWGQFIDHDFGVSPAGNDTVNIPPSGEPGDMIFTVLMKKDKNG